MKLSLGILFICFLLSFTVFGQYDTLRRIEDINKDGHLDTLLRYYQGGSGFGGHYAEIINGANSETFKMDTDGCFCMIRNTYDIPENLLQPENSPFLVAIKQQLFPHFKNEPDPSLSWILNAAVSSHNLESDSLFSKIITPNIPWTKGKVALPSSYALSLKEGLIRPYCSGTNGEASYDLTNKEAVMVYWANVHYENGQDSIQRIARNKMYTLYKTKHGIIAQKANAYKWVFLSDYFTTGAPEKLRWSSIGDVRLFRNHVLFEQRLPPHFTRTFYIINIYSGKLACFSQFVSPNYNLLDPSKQSILFDDGKTEYRFDEIITALENLKFD